MIRKSKSFKIITCPSEKRKPQRTLVVRFGPLTSAILKTIADKKALSADSLIHLKVAELINHEWDWLKNHPREREAKNESF